jgi:rhodanese-related sulfurtransferase
MVDASMPGTISVADVLRGVDGSVFMRDAAWLDDAIASGRAPLIIDLRAESAFLAGHIPGSIAVSLRQLPDQFDTRTPREREIVCVCGGSIQSAMAVVYLRTLGYPNVFNLSGGISAWERTGRPLCPTPGMDRG